MLTVIWEGTFKSELSGPYISHITFVGDDMADVERQIGEYVENMEEESHFDWELVSGKIISSQWSEEKVAQI
jgi:hypothetical protein